MKRTLNAENAIDEGKKTKVHVHENSRNSKVHENAFTEENVAESGVLSKQVDAAAYVVMDPVAGYVVPENVPGDGPAKTGKMCRHNYQPLWT